MRRIFYDWEFQEDGETIKPISLGMVDDTYRQLYLINRDYIDSVQSGEIEPSQWLLDNVLAYISEEDYLNYAVPFEDFPDIVLDFVSDFGRVKSRDDVELWAYYAAYDHVRLAQCWGPMIKLPEPIPMFTHELQQYIEDNLQPGQSLPKQENEHHPVYDAQWNKRVWECLQ
jgi:hypothetical protein